MQLLTTGARIRTFGKLKFKTVKAFADALEMSASNLQFYLSDKRQPGAPILKRLEALGCNSSWLLTGTGMIEKNRPRPHPSLSLEEIGQAGEIYSITAAGKKMTPGMIMEGDTLLIHPGLSPEEGDHIVKNTAKGKEILLWEKGGPYEGVVVQLVRTMKVNAP
ncbi:helix-turn-helix domain-containing protein [Chlorobium phaeovibrioides]|uniref:Uncharacterized protein n=1 Tax=Chlorobium phaeovibrioides TaxID=1094 RepID=A0A5M8IBU3_CHLPH|nr:helix-turn-helix domain-containing protein [Chlorobium phaeovibrioides]KAA6231835.1 hypothetical protein FP507_00985 [Chlorobium phaeovibrioides]MWV53443.1 hypothetical protein [Chlorobium phaeovibrioides]